MTSKRSTLFANPRLFILLTLGFSLGCEPPKSVSQAALTAYETAAFANLAKIGVAQNIHAQENNGQPPKSLTDLAELRPLELRAATSKEKAHQGYYFYILPGQKSDEYYVAASPAEHGKGGVQTYLLCSSGEIYARDLNGEALASAPANPEAEGWTRRRGGARNSGVPEPPTQ